MGRVFTHPPTSLTTLFADSELLAVSNSSLHFSTVAELLFPVSLYSQLTASIPVLGILRPCTLAYTTLTVKCGLDNGKLSRRVKY